MIEYHMSNRKGEEMFKKITLLILTVFLLMSGNAFACITFTDAGTSLKLYGCERRITTNLADQYDPAISGNLWCTRTRVGRTRTSGTTT
jgi:hypothetical protein